MKEPMSVLDRQLLDSFAVAALTGLLANSRATELYIKQHLASDAYAIAKAMMTEREKT